MLPGVLLLCLTWAEVSCVPHECVRGVALRCGWHCAITPLGHMPWVALLQGAP